MAHQFGKIRCGEERIAGCSCSEEGSFPLFAQSRVLGELRASIFFDGKYQMGYDILWGSYVLCGRSITDQITIYKKLTSLPISPPYCRFCFSGCTTTHRGSSVIFRSF